MINTKKLLIGCCVAAIALPGLALAAKKAGGTIKGVTRMVPVLTCGNVRCIKLALVNIGVSPLKLVLNDSMVSFTMTPPNPLIASGAVPVEISVPKNGFSGDGIKFLQYGTSGGACIFTFSGGTPGAGSVVRITGAPQGSGIANCYPDGINLNMSVN